MTKRRRLTKSQIVTGVATGVAILSSLAVKLIPFAAMLGPVGPWLPIIVIGASVLTAAFNQSLSANHTSVPNDVALAHGIINKQTQHLIGDDDEDSTDARSADDTTSRPGL